MLATGRLTIGSAPGQLLQLTAAGVEARHAVLSANRFTGIRLLSLSGKSVIVNGRRQTRSRIKPGDVLEIGVAKLIVRRARSRRVVILEVQEHERAATDAVPGSLGESPAAGPRMSSWSWSLAIATATVFLLIPLMGLVGPAVQKGLRQAPLVPSDALWSPGPLHTAHQSIGSRCEACHIQPFQPVRDQACLACHGELQQHVAAHTADVSLFHDTQCTTCHLEHKKPTALVQGDPRLCADCHTDLHQKKSNTRLRDVSDFGRDHPEFRLTTLTLNPAQALASQGLAKVSGGSSTSADHHGDWRLSRLDRNDPENFVERSHLRFPHAKHLNPKGVQSPSGERVLSCQDCHKPDASGRQMQPIRMEAQCSGCHSLRFDEKDPNSAVPHGNPEAVVKTLREHFSREYLLQSSAAGSAGQLRRPGAEVMSEAEQKRAREWVDAQSLTVARELFEKRVCAQCHEVTRVPGKSGLDQWQVEPVRLTSNWMPQARFNHAAHASEKCVSCHGDAPKSEHSSDILIPGIARCRECHGGPSSTTKVASNCLMCHQFHIPGRGPWQASSKVRQTAQR